MDDSCAVCADALEWVAYGACGHREVCSTCVTRLRFVLDDPCCCICKTDNPCVFVTKATGEYTTVITDFSIFPENPTEGRSGKYWYHEGTHAFFDDAEHYKMIRAMCRLSCSVCDKNGEEQEGELTKRRCKFKSIEQLKGHLYHQHRLFMCSLCLEGRKVFVCEQKLYTRSQLNRHISTGDSEVDGSESERGGFMGHPMCEFCRNPSYGENELYMHMSTEHYTCHICQRQHPGQYDYYRNYDDLETHYRQQHFLCENEACLEKKFVVFQSEAELKRHNALEHGGHMSRSKRNTVLQIPTSFRYRRTNEREQRRRRGCGFRSDPSDDQLSTTIQASLETVSGDGRRGGQSSAVERNQRDTDTICGSLETLNINQGSSSSTVAVPNSGTVPILGESAFPPLSDRDPPETSSRYAQALGQGPLSSARLGEESFPPLPGTEKSSKPKPKTDPMCLGENTLSARLQLRNRILNSSRPRASELFERGASSSSNSIHVRQEPSLGLPSANASGSGPPPWPTPQEVTPSSSANLLKPRENRFTSLASSSARNASIGKKMRHSSSAPNLAHGGSSLAQSMPQVKYVHEANKTLVEKIRAGLGLDEDMYAAFRSISVEYRQGVINTFEYLSYVEQFGLTNLVFELARLCPDAQKQKELIDAYNASIQAKRKVENGEQDVVASKEKSAKKGKGIGKSVDHPGASIRDASADNFIDTVRKLQPSFKSQEDDKVEVISKDGYRTGKVQQAPVDATGSGSNHSTGNGESSKHSRKTSKFHRIRLGDGSAAALFDLNRNVSPERAEEYSSERARMEESGEGLPVRGVWRNGGGLKLVASQRDYSQ